MTARRCTLGKRWLLTIACLAGILCAGCGTLDVTEGAGYTGDDATWGESLRPKPKSSSGSKSAFFDPRSHQIEQSLGVSN